MRRYWTAAEIRKLRRLYPNMENGALGERFGRSWSAIQNMAVKLGLRKSPEFMASPVCRFPKGNTAWNKGKRHNPPGSRATRFRKGHRPVQWQPIGTERMTKDGTLERKVRNPGVWKTVKDIIWEAKHGRIPAGHFVVHRNRNRQDFRLRNLTLVDRSENMKRNTYHRYPKEIARLIQLRGALNRQINKRAAA